MANLGFVGLGVMGGEMVNRLLAKGHNVTGYKSEPAIESGVVGQARNEMGRFAPGCFHGGGHHLFDGDQFSGVRRRR